MYIFQYFYVFTIFIQIESINAYKPIILTIKNDLIDQHRLHSHKTQNQLKIHDDLLINSSKITGMF